MVNLQKRFYPYTILLFVVLIAVVGICSSSHVLATYSHHTLIGPHGKYCPVEYSSIYTPKGIDINSKDEIFIVDSELGMIKKVSKGIIRTIAGSGNLESLGDGGPAIESSFSNYIEHVVHHPITGELYISDTDEGVIRKIYKNGTIDHYAGTYNSRTYSVSDEGADPKSIHIAPCGMAFDEIGNMYITDINNHCIRKIDHVNQTVTTVAGVCGQSGNAPNNVPATSGNLDQPRSVAIYKSELYFADTENYCIRKINSSDGNMVIVAGDCGNSGDSDGPVSSATFDVIYDIKIKDGMMYIADQDNSMLRLLNMTSMQVSTISGRGASFGDGGLAADAQLEGISGIALDSKGNIYITQGWDYYVRVINATTGIINTFIGSWEVPKKAVPIDCFYAFSPKGLTVLPNNDLIFTDLGRIYKISYGWVYLLAGDTNDPSKKSNFENPLDMYLSSPTFPTISPIDNQVYFSEFNADRVLKFNDNFTKIELVAQQNSYNEATDAYSAIMSSDIFCMIVYNDDIYFCDGLNRRIRKIFQNGTIETVVGSEYGTPTNGDHVLNTKLTQTGAIGFLSNGTFVFTNERDVIKVNTDNTITILGSAPVTITGGDIYNDVLYFVSQDCYLKSFSFITNTFTSKSNSMYNNGARGCYSLTIDPIGGKMYIPSNWKNLVFSYPLANPVSHTIVAGSASSFSYVENAIATTTNVPNPIDAVVYNGDLYICAKSPHMILKVSSSTTRINRFLGYQDQIGSEDGEQEKVRLSSPSYARFNSKGEMIFLQTGNGRIAKLSNGTVSTILKGNGDGGLATSAKISGPLGITFTPSGDLVLAEQKSLSVRKIDRNTKTISTLMGYYLTKFDETQTLAVKSAVNYPSGMHCSNGDIYVANYIFHTITKMASNGSYSVVAGITNSNGYVDNVQATLAKFKNPSDVHVTLDNQIFVSDSGGYRVRKIDQNGYIQTIAGDGQNRFGSTLSLQTNQTSIKSPAYISVANGGRVVYVVDEEKSGNKFARILVLTNCTLGWYGDNCEMTTCHHLPMNDTNVCSGRGNCTDFETCVCSEGYHGEFCQDFYCYGIEKESSSVCSGRGECVEKNQCQCDGAFYGDQCQNYNCFGVEKNNQSVCSHHGQCVSPNNCSCIADFIGDDCSIYSCFNILSNESSVCSGHGDCISPNNCSCSIGFYGNECQLFECNHLIFNDSSVCNSRGSCISSDQCNCSTGYYDSNCQSFYCFGIQYNDTQRVCGGLGSCQSLDNCTCPYGYNGNECELFDCYGIQNNQSNVCSSHGVCSSPNNCSCAQGYYGNNCELFDCYGNLFNSSLVCSSNGQCSLPNNCSCAQGYYGNKCELFDCFGVPKNHSSVCSSLNGTCTSPNNCTCRSGYYGNECDLFNCFDNLFNESKVCSSHGLCLAPNQCVCNSGWYGNNCDLMFCFGISFNDSTVCSGHGKCNSTDVCSCYSRKETGFWTGSNCSECLPPYSGSNCSIITQNNTSITNNSINNNVTTHNDTNPTNNATNPTNNSTNPTHNETMVRCDKHINCSSHGECNQNDQCNCYATHAEGFWTGSSCNQCKQGYYGEECKTSFSNVKFSNEGTSILIQVTTSGNFSESGVTIDCKNLLLSFNGLGSGVSCVGKVNNNVKSIEINLGEDAMILYEENIEINTNVFDKKPISSPNSLLLPAKRADQPSPPLTMFSKNTKTEFGSCENIVIDASESLCVDRRSLLFKWSMISGPSNLSIYFQQNSPLLVLNYNNLVSGIYKIQLETTSTLSKETNAKIFTFKKLDYDLPTVTLQGMSERLVSVSDIPLFIKKKIEYPPCLASSSEVAIDWKQTSGSSINFEIDSMRNLVIHQFNSKKSETYEFTLSSTYNSISTILKVNITTQLQDISCHLFIADRDSTSLTIFTETNDPENITETETISWECTDLSTGLVCPAYIIQQLQDASNKKIVKISLSETSTKQFVFGVKVKKGERTASKFRTESIVPPSMAIPASINLISMQPSNNMVNYGQIISIQNEVIPSSAECAWTMNSKVLSNNSMTSLMRNIGQTELLVDSTYLDFGETYKFVISTVGSQQVAASAEYSMTVEVPPKCFCTFYPISGVAMTTDFTYYCVNCQYSNINYGFIDDRSGALVPLYMMGSKFSSKLPLPFNGNVLQVFAQIISSTSGTSSIVRQNITMDTPPVSNWAEFNVLVKNWTSISNSLSKNDLSSAIYNSATIARTSIVMGERLDKIQKRAICSNRGLFNVEKNACDCESGYFRKDCRDTFEKFQENQQQLIALLDTFIQTFYMRNKLEAMDWSEFTHELYGLDGLMINYDLLNDSWLKLTLGYLETLLETAVFSKKLVFPMNTFTLLKNSMNSIHNFMKMNGISNFRAEERRLFKMINNILILKMREGFVGMVDYKSSEIEFTSMLSNLYRKRHLSNGISVTLPVGEQNLQTSIPKELNTVEVLSTSKLSQLQFNIFTLPNRVFNTTFKTITSSQVQHNVKIEESSSLGYISKNAVSLSFVNQPVSNLIEPFSVEFLLNRIVHLSELSEVTVVNSQNVKSIEIRALKCQILEENNGVETWNSNPCTIQILDNSDKAICKCSRSGVITITEQVTLRKEISTQFNTNNDYMALLALLTLLPLMLLGCCLIFVCIRRCKKKKQEKPAEPEVSIQMRDIV